MSVEQEKAFKLGLLLSRVGMSEEDKGALSRVQDLAQEKGIARLELEGDRDKFVDLVIEAGAGEVLLRYLEKTAAIRDALSDDP